MFYGVGMMGSREGGGLEGGLEGGERGVRGG